MAVQLKIPKGTADENPNQAFLNDEIITKVKNIFTLHGAVPISTPTFELKEILLNKYGEDTKLIYDLKDQGGEICALRYDLTVPFARYLVQNNIKRIKRYQIGKVFRRDQPSIVKGRLREFVQADFDIAGECINMMADAEVLSCADRILKEFNIGEYKILVNDRKILMAVLQMAKVEEKDFATVTSTIDKKEKLTKNEMISEYKQKGLNDEQIEIIEKYTELIGKKSVLENLKNDPIFEIEECKAGVLELEEIFRLCEIFGCAENIYFSLSLARGLDYYTGMIFEATYTGKDVGSVAGGGRYDNLTDSLTSKKSKVPCVGFSVGISRIFSLLSETYIKEASSSVYVVSSGGLFLDERLELLKILWDGGISCETFYTKRTNFGDFLDLCKKKGIPFIAILGEAEVKEQCYQIYNVLTGEKEKVSKDGVVEFFKMSNIVSSLKKI